MGAKPRGTGRGRSDDLTIKVLAKENPKRPGSQAHKVFALMKTGMKLGEFRKLVEKKFGQGVAGPDISYNIKNGHIRLSS